MLPRELRQAEYVHNKEIQTDGRNLEITIILDPDAYRVVKCY